MKLSKKNWTKLGKNVLWFTAPILVIFLTQLQQGASAKVAGLTALYAFYGVAIDFLKKSQEKK